MAEAGAGDADWEDIRSAIADLMACLYMTAFFCAGPGWPVFSAYLDSAASPESGLVPSSARDDVAKAAKILKMIISSPGLIDELESFLASRPGV